MPERLRVLLAVVEKTLVDDAEAARAWLTNEGCEVEIRDDEVPKNPYQIFAKPLQEIVWAGMRDELRRAAWDVAVILYHDQSGPDSGAAFAEARETHDRADRKQKGELEKPVIQLRRVVPYILSLAKLPSLKRGAAPSGYADYSTREELLNVLAREMSPYIDRAQTHTSDDSAFRTASLEIPVDSLSLPAGEMETVDSKTGPRRFFLCYRREDSASSAGRIYDRLARDFGDAHVFKDVDKVPFGVDFVEHLEREVRKCNVLFVIIGPRWLAKKAGEARARLWEDNDYVRIEIAAALRRSIPVVPILVDGATMPDAKDLPEDIRRLTGRNGIQIRHDPDFHGDMTRLLSRLG